MTMACAAIFFSSMNASTYKHDANLNRSAREVKDGPQTTTIEGATVAFGQVGAAWVFTQIGKQGYEDREDLDFEKTRKERLASYPDGWPDDPWIDMLQLPWVPLRYRYAVRFVLHFACAMVHEHSGWMRRKPPHLIKLAHLKTRLSTDVGNFLGSRARDLLEAMIEQIPDRLGRGVSGDSQASITTSLIYDERHYHSEWVDKPVGDDWAAPIFTKEFNERLKDLRQWNVSFIYLFCNYQYTLLMLNIFCTAYHQIRWISPNR